MGYLKGYENIAFAAGHTPELPSEDVVESFQIDVLNLISDAWEIIRTPDDTSDKPDENQITISLFDACCILSCKNQNNFVVNWESHELTDEIRQGKKKPISAKRFDICFGNWNTPKRIEYGVEAKLLIENDFMGRKSKKLIEEYIGEAGMCKYIKHIYKKRGCMLGYVVEGKISNIVNNINNEIENVLGDLQQLSKVNLEKLKHEEIYKSTHNGNLDYPLFHLLLDFN